MEQIKIHGIPHLCRWEIEPADATIDGDALHITAGGMTDLFRDPRGEVEIDNSPRLLFSPDPRFTVSARVAVDFAAMFDAGVLMVYADATSWAKICFELSPQGNPMIVSVVTNGRSDDCNSDIVEQPTVYLRLSGLGGAYALHSSHDGTFWNLVRYFALDSSAQVRVGFSSQSPRGTGCTAHFDAISYAPTSVADIRSGA